RIVTASDDKTRLWDAETGALVATLEGHTGDVTCCDFSPDGKRIVTGSDDTTARLWDAETGALVTTLVGHTGSIGSCAFSPDGKRIVTDMPPKSRQKKIRKKGDSDELISYQNAQQAGLDGRKPLSLSQTVAHCLRDEMEFESRSVFV
ncbi:WD40-repeat-containing domain protein, partial [Pelagophyceae sp. CCMP2097]